MQRLGWLVAALTLAAGPAWAQHSPRPAGERPSVEGARVERADRPQLPADHRPAGRKLDQAIELKVHTVVDGLVIGGQELPKQALEGSLGQLFAHVAHEGDIRPNVIHGNRLYRSYLIAPGSGLKESDFQRYVGNTVRVKLSELQAGRQYAIVAIVP